MDSCEECKTDEGLNTTQTSPASSNECDPRIILKECLSGDCECKLDKNLCLAYTVQLEIEIKETENAPPISSSTFLKQLLMFSSENTAVSHLLIALTIVLCFGLLAAVTAYCRFDDIKVLFCLTAVWLFGCTFIVSTALVGFSGEYHSVYAALSDTWRPSAPFLSASASAAILAIASLISSVQMDEDTPHSINVAIYVLGMVTVFGWISVVLSVFSVTHHFILSGVTTNSLSITCVWNNLTHINLLVAFAASVCQGALSLQFRSTNKFFIGVLLFIGCVLSLFHLLVESLSTSDLSGYDARPKRKAELQKQINIIRFTSELMMCVGLAAITMACNVDM